jgi:membrane protease YdiL (CAAX protease family)
MAPAFLPLYYVTNIGWYHLAVFGLFIPWAAWRSRRKLADVSRPLPDRVRHYRSQTFLLIAFGGLSLLTARMQALPLLPPALPPLSGIALGAVVFAVAVTVMRPYWRRAVARKQRVTQLFQAQTPVERAWWLAVAVLAGMSEEITWRGVQFALLQFLTGSALAAALLSAASFALGHAVQGWRSMSIVAVFALVFQALAIATGSLYVPMLVHAAYDITAGWTYGRFATETAGTGT